jgi:penicillin-binding protein 1B
MARRLALLALLALALFYAPWHLWPHERLVHRVVATPARVYARPLVLAPGLRVARDALSDHLVRAGYRAMPTAEAALEAPGGFHLGSRRWQVHLRPFAYPDGLDEGGAATVELDAAGRVRAIQDGDGLRREALLLPPEPIGTLLGESDEDRLFVPLAEVPPHLVAAVRAAEDRRFRLHPGIDPIRVAGALWVNLREGGIREGGSTITQQLAKNAYLSSERTVARKLREAALALWMEVRFSKDEILEAYLNQVYLGQDGGRGIHGVGRGARFVFGRPVGELAPHEGALLAAMIRAPNALSPHRHPERARAARDRVLARLRDAGHLDVEAYESAVAAPLGVRREAPPSPFAGHFLEGVRDPLVAGVGRERLERDGLRVFTTLDGTLQRAAEAAVREELARLERAYPLLRRPRSPLQAALVALDPRTGDVLALVGGRSFEEAPFDRATRARRQPGSLAKPVVALAALGAETRPPLTLATVLEDAPLVLEVEGRRWVPSNHDRRHRGPVTLRQALEQSLNVPLARLGLEVGLVEVAETARRLGIESPLRPIPSLTLGAFETTPLEIASAYAVLASGGIRTRPRRVLAALRPDGRVLGGERRVAERVVGEARAYVVTDALRGVVDRGTARSLRTLGVSAPFAGKTGTTNDFRDAWFVGYAPDLVVAVWVGFDDGARVGLTGAQAALPIFARFVRRGVGEDAIRAPDVPRGVEVVRRGGREEVFVAGTAPRPRERR